MKYILTLMLMGTSLIANINAAEGAFQYPSAPTTNQVDTFFGIQVQDPYRWMEDNNSPLLKKMDHRRKSAHLCLS